MKKSMARVLGALFMGAMLLGTAMAEPANSSSQLAMGPDRVPRSPGKAVTAPVHRPEPVRREKVETVVAPVVQTKSTFVYKKTECKTLTNVVYDIWGAQHRVTGRPAVYMLDEGKVHMWSPTDTYLDNRLGKMEADREFLDFQACQRLGVWANGGIAGSAPTAIVSDMVSKVKSLTCGDYSAPKEINIAGVPVIQATGVDVYGNYFYEFYSFERFGNTYAFASRVPYKARYNVERNTNLAYLITHIHPAVWVE